MQLIPSRNCTKSAFIVFLKMQLSHNQYQIKTIPCQGFFYDTIIDVSSTYTVTWKMQAAA